MELENVRDRLSRFDRELVSLPDGAGADERLEELQPGRGGRIIHLGVRPIPISSSAIRRLAAAGNSLAGLVPPTVAKFLI